MLHQILLNTIESSIVPGDILLGEWLGNSSPGQLKDSSGNGRDLTMTGSIPNSTSPTPPEGDRWLGYHPTDGDEMYIPLDAISLTKGKLQWKFSVDNYVGGNKFMFMIRDGDSSNLIYAYYGGDGNLHIDIYNDSVLGQTLVPIAGDGTIYTMDMKWGSDGLHIKIDNNPVWDDSNPFVFADTGFSRSILGGFSTGSSWTCGGMDAVKSWQRIDI